MATPIAPPPQMTMRLAPLMPVRLSSRRLVMRRDQARRGHGDALAGGNVQEFVGAMRIGVRSQNAGDDELGVGELLAQHAHEGDRAAFAHVGGRLAEGFLRGLPYRLLEPGCQRRRVPAALSVPALEGD